MKPNLNDMIVFLAVVEARSFSAAAENMGRTRSAVSQSVSRLEGEVGARLLYRTTRSLTLTDAGTRLASRCRQIRQSYNNAVSDLQEASKEPSGSITITAPHALCDSLMVPVVAQCMAAYANIKVRLIAEDARIDLIEAQIDLAVGVGLPTGQTARIAKLGMMSESLYASASYVKNRGGIPADPSKISEWDHIGNDWQGSPINYKLKAGLQLSVEPGFRCNAFPQIIAATTQGLGVARLPDLAAQANVISGNLVAIAKIGATPIYSAHHFDKRPPQKVKVFIDALRQQLKMA